MGITVGELIDLPHLRTRLYAGTSGRDNPITWAHSCEVPNPWNWLEEGDLLMTNGYSLPAEPDGQVEFVEQLHAAGISGLAIGEEQHAPPITEAMRQRAEALGVPILFTAYEVPFVALARTVADANSRREQLRLQQTVRLYDRLREATIGGGDAKLLDRLSDDLNANMYVLDPDRGLEMLPRQLPPSEVLRENVLEAMRHTKRPLPGLSRVSVDATNALVVPVPSQREAVLVAVPRSSKRLDLAILQHVATISALQLERETAEREQRRRLGAETLAHLVDGRADMATASQQLAAQGLAETPLIIAASDAGGPTRGPLHHRLADRGVPHLLLRRADTLLVLLPNDSASLGALRDELGPAPKIGVGDPFTEPSRAPDAAREAHWALQAAISQQVEVLRYGESAPLFMPRTLNELQGAVRTVLGALLDYDEAQGTELVTSLRTFLRHNRSWQRAAKELYVHKQTLVYRMRRVEELTGRKLDDTASVAEFWLALRAMDVASRSSSSPD
ncbi:MAG: PucR family transcriptional regulator [Solirubrobacteraceae bacterium]